MSRPLSHPGRLRLLLLATGVLFSAILLVILEIVASFFVTVRGKPVLRGDTVSIALNTLEVNQAPLVADDELLWRNEPYARKVRNVNPRPFGTEQKWSIAINSEGFRGPERKPKPDAYRVLALGDSITYGFNVDQADSYPAQLGELLKKRYPDRDIEVINAGVPGWTWLQGQEFLQIHGPDLKPDVVVMGHGTNDQFFLAQITDKERFRVINNPIKRSLHFVMQLWFQSNLYFATAGPREQTEELSTECRKQIAQNGSCRRVTLEEIAAAIHWTADLAAKGGMDLLLVNTDFVRTAAVRGIEIAVKREPLNYLDLTQVIDDRRKVEEDALSDELGLSRSELGAGEDLEDPRQVTFRVRVSDTSHKYRVEVKPFLGNYPPQVVDVFDDASHDDEKPGDRVYSNTVTLPETLGTVEFRFFQEDVPEFIPLPPIASGLSGRRLDARRSGFAPVVDFGKSIFMAERAHPNRRGHEVVTAVIADRLTAMPSFQKRVLTTAH